MSNRPMLSQQEAADRCGVSRTTIRRHHREGRLPNTVVDDDGAWHIPVEDLLAAGLRLNAPAPPDGTPNPSQDNDREADGASSEVARLRSELAEARERLIESEAGRRAAEEVRTAQAAHIADLQQMLTALAPAPERASIPAPTRQPDPTPDPPAAEGPASSPNEPGGSPGARRRWWRRS
ncbi:helix-turn-helix domain-containing protein [Streptomyces diacarni]|uniref:helix-turn-helix domain-containing protein n=1 Tax=Streptomyces diacarni TaxID=2800381 RepID=UPI0033E80DA0